MNEGAARGRFQRLLAVARDLLAELEYEYERAMNEAVRDPLTGVNNRRLFQLRLEQELSRARRYDHRLTLVMLDIDHFKQFNDAHGHRAGDEVLRRLAILIQRELREPDMFFRVGGEEFAILLPETDVTGAAALVERLRNRIMRDGSLPITLSFGLAEFPTHAEGPEPLIEAADQALYASKQAGRNLAHTADGVALAVQAAAAATSEYQGNVNLQPVEVGFHIDGEVPASIWLGNRILRVRDAIVVTPAAEGVEVVYHIGTDAGDLRLVCIKGRWYLEGHNE